MKITVTYYLDVISSWCYWAEPAWAKLKQRYAEQARFVWKIALMDESGMPKSHAQMDWFYRRSGLLMRSPFMLKSGWHELGKVEYLAPNGIAEAAKDFGVTDDRVRLALAEAGLRQERPTGQWEVAAEIAAGASGLDAKRLLERGRSPEVESRLRASTAEFHALQVAQRPTFLIESEIGDRAVFSGLVRFEPLAAALDAMLEDLRGYEAHKAHFGDPPPG